MMNGTGEAHMMPPNLTAGQARALQEKTRMAQAVTTFVAHSCSGGWAVPDHLRCPECGADSAGRCHYDLFGGAPPGEALEKDQEQWVLL